MISAMGFKSQGKAQMLKGRNGTGQESQPIRIRGLTQSPLNIILYSMLSATDGERCL